MNSCGKQTSKLVKRTGGIQPFAREKKRATGKRFLYPKERTQWLEEGRESPVDQKGMVPSGFTFPFLGGREGTQKQPSGSMSTVGEGTGGEFGGLSIGRDKFQEKRKGKEL